MNIYLWMRDEMTARSKVLQVVYLRASTFLLGHWFELYKEDLLPSKDVCFKSVRYPLARPEGDLRIMAILGIEYLSGSHFIHLWNWSTTVYKELYLPSEVDMAGDFAIDVYSTDNNPYEDKLGSATVINLSAGYDELLADFREAAPLLGKSLNKLQDPNRKIDIECACPLN